MPLLAPVASTYRYFSFAIEPISRVARVEKTKADIYQGLSPKQEEFLEFVLSKYVENGVEELDDTRLPSLLLLKYSAYIDAEKVLGNIDKIRGTFFRFQKYLYQTNTQKEYTQNQLVHNL